MDLKTKVKTDYGEVALEEVIKAYNQKKANGIQRAEWLKTDEGKAYNCAKAAEYYAENKAEVLLKRALRYEDDKDTLREKSLAYYHANKERIQAKAKERREQLRAERAAVTPPI